MSFALTLGSVSLVIPANQVRVFNSASISSVGVDYTVTGVPAVRGVNFEGKFLWNGIEVFLTEEEYKKLINIKLKQDDLRVSQSDFRVQFYETGWFPFSEDAPRTRDIAPGTSEDTTTVSGSAIYFPIYYVQIENIESQLSGKWRQTSFDLIELDKTVA